MTSHSISANLGLALRRGSPLRTFTRPASPVFPVTVEDAYDSYPGIECSASDYFPAFTLRVAPKPPWSPLDAEALLRAAAKRRQDEKARRVYLMLDLVWGARHS